MAALAGQTAVRVGRQQWGLASAALSQHQQTRSQANVVRSQTSNLAAHKRGRGGRSSFNGNVVTVFGATGFFGRYVVNKLGKVGCQVILPYRGDDYFLRELKLCGDLGQILKLPFQLRDDESVRRAMKHSNVVINLIGSQVATRNFTFSDVNVAGAERIARNAKEVGVERLIHVSHLNATYNPTPIFTRNGSEFLRTKMEGEDAVRNAFPDAIIFRPSDAYGSEDWYLNYYLNKWRGSDINTPLWQKGLETIKMPVDVSDVAEGIVNAAVQDPEAVGKIFEAVGPQAFTQRELIDFFYRILRRPNRVTSLHKYSPLVMRWQALAMVNRQIPYSMDKLDQEAASDKLTGQPTLEDLGVRLQQLENRWPFLLKGRFKDAYLDPVLGQWPDPEPPKASVLPVL